MNARRAKLRLLLLGLLVVAGEGYAAYIGLGLKARIGATRTPVPRRHDVRLAAGKYDVYFELPGDYDKYNQFAEPSDLAVAVAQLGGRPLPLARYAGTSYIGSSTAKALAIDTVEVPRSGLYRIATHWPGGGRYHSTVVLGVPPGTAYIRLVAGGVIALLAFILLCILGPGTVALLRQGSQQDDRRAGPRDVPVVGGGQPALSGSQAQSNPSDQLRKLTELRDRGALTDEEFETQRTRLLGLPA
jgi:hypothetical protein